MQYHAGEKLCEALTILKNECNEVWSFFLTPTKKHSEIRPALNKVSKSIELLKQQEVQVCYTDNCDDTLPIFRKEFNQKEFAPTSKIKISTSSTVVDGLLYPYLKYSEKNKVHVHLDVEWTVSYERNQDPERSRIGLIQLCFLNPERIPNFLDQIVIFF